jgi:hypothetical protein
LEETIASFFKLSEDARRHYVRMRKYDFGIGHVGIYEKLSIIVVTLWQASHRILLNIMSYSSVIQHSGWLWNGRPSF